MCLINNSILNPSQGLGSLKSQKIVVPQFKLLYTLTSDVPFLILPTQHWEVEGVGGGISTAGKTGTPDCLLTSIPPEAYRAGLKASAIRRGWRYLKAKVGIKKLKMNG
jgi:hypothetical protein